MTDEARRRASLPPHHHPGKDQHMPDTRSTTVIRPSMLEHHDITCPRCRALVGARVYAGNPLRPSMGHAFFGTEDGRRAACILERAGERETVR